MRLLPTPAQAKPAAVALTAFLAANLVGAIAPYVATFGQICS